MTFREEISTFSVQTNYIQQKESVQDHALCLVIGFENLLVFRIFIVQKRKIIEDR
jgi:hypothetical protein